VNFATVVSNPDLSAHEKLLLLVLSDDSEPVSISTLATKISLSTRGVMRTILALKTAGLLTVERVPGGCNRYSTTDDTLSLVTHRHPRHTVTPDTVSLVAPVLPATICKSLKDLKDNINTKDKTKDNNPRVRMRAPAMKAGLDISGKPAMLTNDGVANLIEYRKEKKKPLTQRALNAIFKQLEIAAKAGWQPDDVIDHMIQRHWTGINANWLINEKQHRGQYETGKRLSLSERTEAAADALRRKIASGEISNRLDLPVAANGRDLW
jgi:DNA-binding transcriptional ArsR family regulator